MQLYLAPCGAVRSNELDRTCILCPQIHRVDEWLFPVQTRQVSVSVTRSPASPFMAGEPCVERCS
jgi:hypothetical protein